MKGGGLSWVSLGNDSASFSHHKPLLLVSAHSVLLNSLFSIYTLAFYPPNSRHPWTCSQSWHFKRCPLHLNLGGDFTSFSWLFFWLWNIFIWCIVIIHLCISTCKCVLPLIYGFCLMMLSIPRTTHSTIIQNTTVDAGVPFQLYEHSVNKS